MIVDLSILLDNNTPVYPGDDKPVIEQVWTFEDQGCVGHKMSLINHTGTHIDAPAHFIHGGKVLSDYAVDSFVGRGVLVNIEDNLEAVISKGVQSGDIVLVNTGMSGKLFSPEYFNNYPVLAADVVDYLISIGIKMLGIDCPSVDNTDDFAHHKVILAAGILIIENLTNLHALIGKNFEVIALPLKVELDGSPARVIAKVID
jgi:arylformamidase